MEQQEVHVVVGAAAGARRGVGAAASGGLLPIDKGPRGTETFDAWLRRTTGRPVVATRVMGGAS